MSNESPGHPLGGARAWAIWSLAALSFGYAFFHRVAPSVMVSDLMADFAIGGAMLGTLSALYFYPYVLLQIPLGALLDAIGARVILTCALGLAAVGSLIFGTATSIEMAYVGRILIGVGSSVGFLGSLSLAAAWFPAHYFAMMAGLAMFCAMMSGMAAQAPLAFFVESYGWRSAMWGLGIAGAVIAVLILVFVRNHPDPAAQRIKPKQSFGAIWRGLLRAASMREVWKIALVAACLSGPMLALAALWGTPYLMAAYDLSRPEAAFYASLMLFGWAFGAPLFGRLSDYFGRRKPFLVVGAVVLSLCLLAIVLLDWLPLWAIVALFFVAGASGSVMSATFALARDVAPAEITGSVTGIVNSMTVASGAVLQPLVGLMLDLVWSGEMAEGARLYSAADYRLSFWLVLSSAVLGLVTALFLREPSVTSLEK